MSATKPALPTLMDYVRDQRGTPAYNTYTTTTPLDETSNPELSYAHHVLATIADPDLLTAWTAQALSSPITSLRESIAANPHTPTAVLDCLLDDPDTRDSVRYWLARNPSLNASQVERLYRYIATNPAPANIVPSIAVALASRIMITPEQVRTLRAINHWRLNLALLNNPRVGVGNPVDHVTAWFMTPLRPSCSATSDKPRRVHFTYVDGTWNAEIHVATPRHGAWTVILHDIDWTRSYGNCWLGPIDTPTADDIPAPVTSTEPRIHEPVWKLAGAARILAQASIETTGITTNHAGTVTSISDDGVTWYARSGNGDLALHARTLTYRP